MTGYVPLSAVSVATPPLTDCRVATAPQTQFYNNLGQECVQAGVSVSLFLVNNAYADLPTVGQVVRLTGGEVHKYTYFQVRGSSPGTGARFGGLCCLVFKLGLMLVWFLLNSNLVDGSFPRPRRDTLLVNDS